MEKNHCSYFQPRSALYCMLFQTISRAATCVWQSNYHKT